MKNLLFILLFFPIIGYTNSNDYLLQLSNTNQVVTYLSNNTKKVTFNKQLYKNKLLEKLHVLDVKVPLLDENYIDVTLIEFSVIAPKHKFFIETKKGKIEQFYESNLKSYRIMHKNKSIGVFIVQKNFIIASYKFNDTQFEISEHKGELLLFDVNDCILKNNFSCAVEKKHKKVNKNPSFNKSVQNTPKCLELALEIDNYTRNTFSNNTACANWGEAIIAGVSQLYNSDINVDISIVNTIVWDTPDPYAGFVNDASNMLSALRNYWTANNGSISRDLVHLLTKRSNTGTGGIAYLDVLCDNYWGYGFSSALNNTTTFNFPNPPYSWNLNVVSHEIGHNVGSSHTHDCVWNSDSNYGFTGPGIDDCGPTAGYGTDCGPTPTNGTTMSYCHLTSTGINIGFHPIVINQALQPGVNNASCLTLCDYYGCTDPTAYNYDPNATIDDGSCNDCTTLSAISQSTELECPSSNTGTATIIAVGGMSPYTYLWNDGQTTETAIGLTVGAYSCIVSDVNNCQYTESVFVSPSPNGLASTISNVPVSCFGGSNGSATVNVNGGVPGYTYEWNDSLMQTTSTATGLTEGVYTCIIRDSKGCVITKTTTITEPSYPLSATISTTPETCFLSNGTATVIASGGTPGYSYTWDDTLMQTSSIATGLIPGNYQCTIIDSNNCFFSISSSVLQLFSVFGCTDSVSFNYDPLANCDNGSCIPFIYGCMDSIACNYNLFANTDNGNCSFSESYTSIISVCDSLLWNGNTYTSTGFYTFITPADPIINPPSGTISTLSYCASNPAPAFITQPSTIIKNVELTGDNFTINNFTGGYNDFYEDYTATMYADISGGETYTVNVIAGNLGGASDYDPEVINVYIDFNIDGDFLDVGEDLGKINIPWGTWVPGTIYPFNFMVPTTGVFGPTRMRVVCMSNSGWGVTMGPCESPIGQNTPWFGTTEDYSIILNSYSGLCDSITFLDLTITTCSDSGCTDPLANNYDLNALFDDSSCTYTANCELITPISGLYVDGIIDDRAVLHFDNMNTYDANGNQICRVDQIRIKYREVGTSTWIQKNIASPTGYDANGVCNSTQKTDKILYGLSLGTTYEWRVKVWYCSGQVTGWVNGPNFTTLGECPNIGNTNAYGSTPTRATFTWDDSNGAYDFVRIKIRVDSVQNPSLSDFIQVGGAGVPYGTFTKNKNGLTPGQTYRGQGRTWCDPNGGAYNSLGWTPFLPWIQPTNRIDGGDGIKDLDIYPNPSRDVFNISFTSETIQDLRVVVHNIVGEELIIDDLQQFIGEYTKKINLKENAKGIYLLEIETNEVVINKKLILQ